MVDATGKIISFPIWTENSNITIKNRKTFLCLKPLAGILNCSTAKAKEEPSYLEYQLLNLICATLPIKLMPHYALIFQPKFTVVVFSPEHFEKYIKNTQIS
jgi:hypothetical protein